MNLLKSHIFPGESNILGVQLIEKCVCVWVWVRVGVCVVRTIPCSSALSVSLH